MELPFTVNSNYHFSCAFREANIAHTAGTYIQGYAVLSTTQVRIQEIPTGGGTAGDITLDTSGVLIVTGTYVTTG